MRTLGTVLLSIASAAAVSAAVAGAFAPHVPPPAADDDAAARRLAARIAALEQSLAADPARGAARDAHVYTPAVRSVVEPATSDDATAALSARIDALERRVEALGSDPLLRAYGYLTSASPQARREAVELLRRFAQFDPAARDAIRSLLHDADADVRREAVEAIGRIGDREALGRVQALLADGDVGVRREAADALEDLLSGLPKDSARFREGIEALAARAADGDARVREEIADSIGDLGPELATPMLVGLLDDPESDVRDEAIEALGRSGDAAALPHLRRLYETGAATDRLDVAIAMARLGDPSAFRGEAVALVATASDRNLGDRERARAIAILGDVDPAGYRAVLTRALEDPSSRVRREAERALRGIR